MKRQTLRVEKYQIMHGATVNSRSWRSASPSSELNIMPSFWRGPCGKQKSKNNSGRPDKHYLRQVIKVNTNSGKSWWDYIALTWCAENYCGLTPASHNSSLVLGKISGKSQWRDIKIPDQFSKLSSSSKTKKVWETIMAKRSLRGHDD